MYGTVARMPVSADNVEALRKEMEREDYTEVPGFRQSFMLMPDEPGGDVYVVAVFDDKDTYTKNADDPAQHERYLRYRALLAAEPEWHDGELVAYP